MTDVAGRCPSRHSSARFSSQAFSQPLWILLWRSSCALPSLRSLFLANHALRVELADIAALAAGGRIDHRVDERRPAGVHGLVHGTAELVGRRHADANAAERF